MCHLFLSSPTYCNGTSAMAIMSALFSTCFFFKQKTAYEMRISDWSSDVCSSDLTVSAAQISEKPNVIVIYIDELRWDALGITGHPFVKTPNIEDRKSVV